MAIDATDEMDSIEKAIQRDILAALKSRSVSSPGSTSMTEQEIRAAAETPPDFETEMFSQMAKHATRAK